MKSVSVISLFCAALAFAPDGRGDGSALMDYAAMRKELRAFYPDECHDTCRSPVYAAVDAAIRKEVTEYAAKHPDYDAYELRRVCYRAMRRHFRPFLFRSSPFYCEAGENGGWVLRRATSRIVNNLCRRFYVEKGLFPEEAQKRQHERARQHYAFCCGPMVDDMHHVPAFHRIFTKGFSGVRADVEKALAGCPADDVKGRRFLETALEGIDTIHALQLKFADEAERLLASGEPGWNRRFLERIAESARRCPWEPPRTFYEGLNLLWFIREIPSYVDALASYSLGRPDAWLIDLYRKDIAEGRLTRAEAEDLVSRWMIISDCHYDGMITVDGGDDHEAEMPVTLGGCDAEGRPVWNELTRMFIERHKACDLVFPKLHVRCGSDTPRECFETIAGQLIDGHAVFALFNDRPAIDGFVRHGIPLERARDYVACGCWDGNVDTCSDADVANYMSAMRPMEAMIHRNPEEEGRLSWKVEPMDAAADFEEVKAIYLRNLLSALNAATDDYTRYGKSAAEVLPHPAYSACLDGCLERRRDTTDGGTFFRPRVVTLAFTPNVVDSLCAIRKVCFEDRLATLPEFLDAVRSNWSGPRGEELRAAAMSAPYWGDDSDASSGLMRWLFESVAADYRDRKNDNGGPYVLSGWVYREFLYWGLKMKATPDGRRDGDRLAQGLAPSEYRCREGVTTVINAVSRFPHEALYASNVNLTFEKEGMKPETLGAIFHAFFSGNGPHLLQPNCNSVEELLDAQIHPERHRNLMVKVCGFSARFIALSRRWQDEIIRRHRLK